MNGPPTQSQQRNSMQCSQILASTERSNQERERAIRQATSEGESSRGRTNNQDDDESPYYSRFADKGTEAVKTMTGFTIAEFMELYSFVEKALQHKGRGKKPKVRPMDAFFLTLVMLKHYEKWDKFATTYDISRQIAENTIANTLQKIKEPLLAALVKPIFKDEQTKKNYVCSNFAEAILIVDVTFQTRTRPTMLYREAQVYFCGKHKAYGYKTEIAHAPNGLAMFVGASKPGSIHDFSIFQDNVETYNEFLKKKAEDRTITDRGELRAKYPNQWALMADKGYQGAAELCRAILPKKGRNLTDEDDERNDRIASDRVICENFYGRMKKLFKIMEDKFRWDEGTYGTVVHVCAALTNFHLLKNPLRREDGDFYQAVLERYAGQELDRKRKRKEANANYRDRQKRQRT